MRILAALIACALVLPLAGCLTTREDGSPRVETSSEANRESLKSAAQAPLRDLNVARTKVPKVLLEAMADPYARPPNGWKCPQMIALSRPLDDALGADLDTPSKDEDDLMEKGRGAGLGFVAGAASDAIPFRGWVRRLSGAERHDRFVQGAINAGVVRRAYLKGLGESKGCEAPATPSHLPAGGEIPTQDMKPRYPIR